MRQAEVVVSLIKRQQVVQSRFAFGQCSHFAPQSRDMLTDAQVQAFHEGGVDDPPHALRQHDLDCFQAAIDNAMANAQQAVDSYRQLGEPALIEKAEALLAAINTAGS